MTAAGQGDWFVSRRSAVTCRPGHAMHSTRISPIPTNWIAENPCVFVEFVSSYSGDPKRGEPDLTIADSRFEGL